MEKEILSWVKQNFNKDARIMEGYFPEYDIHCPDVGNIEVKEDRMAHGTGNYAIEKASTEGYPSGISVTTAEMFCQVDYEYVTFIPTYCLKELVKGSTLYNMGFGKGTKGWLIPRNLVLNHPAAKVMERWFELWLK